MIEIYWLKSKNLAGDKKGEDMPYQGVKRRVFFSHYTGDCAEFDTFIDLFANYQKVFTPYVLGTNDFKCSANTD